jgi:hypothetical protein
VILAKKGNMKFKWSVIASLGIYLGLGIGTADALTPAKAEQLVRWTGCKSDVEFDPTAPVLNSFFTHHHLDYDVNDKGLLYLGIQPYEGLTEEMEIAVLFHEAGHCLQYQNDKLRDLGRAFDTVPAELDADRQSTDLMCAYKMDGRQILHDLFVWARETFGYIGDPGHGTLWERISQANSAYNCEPNRMESPWLAR